MEHTTPTPNGSTLRLAALADVHCTRESEGALRPLFAEIARQADAIVICGDLTAYGLPEEAAVLVKELDPATRLPILAVLGNHEYESAHQQELVRILEDGGVRMLDGDAREVHGVGFAGVKGFGGGFIPHRLEPWGEDAMKLFVREAVDEAVKLESALARLRTPQRIAVTHYAPIRATVVGEPEEIFPFLGSSRLEEPINQYGVSVALHGHAHRGTAQGRTRTDVPVYNVCVPQLAETFPGRPPFRILQIPVAGGPIHVM